MSQLHLGQTDVRLPGKAVQVAVSAQQGQQCLLLALLLYTVVDVQSQATSARRLELSNHAHLHERQASSSKVADCLCSSDQEQTKKAMRKVFEENMEALVLIFGALLIIEFACAGLS